MSILREDIQKVYPLHKRRHKAQRLESMDEHHIKMSRMRSMAAIHYSGDTSKYVYGQDANFKGYILIKLLKVKFKIFI